jgi:hypothetical protein
MLFPSHPRLRHNDYTMNLINFIMEVVLTYEDTSIHTSMSDAVVNISTRIISYLNKQHNQVPRPGMDIASNSF